MSRRRDALECWQAWALLAVAVGIGSWWRGELAAVEASLVEQERGLDDEQLQLPGGDGER